VADFNRLPVDTHEILGLVAPRGLLVLGEHGWASPVLPEPGLSYRIRHDRRGQPDLRRPGSPEQPLLRLS
jgi:hypothetical protein